MDPQPSAPAVVAVVVTCNPGWWFESCLGALAEQDYPNLSVLVIDAASDEDPTGRVAAVMPSAYVRRLAERPGYAASANEVLGVVEGASHFLFCHDDVAPEPDAVRMLVEEAFRSNAGLVTPKFVEWEEPQRLLAVGAGADKAGSIVGFVERGELDQEQHDAVRDVFVAPAGCTLVRADLFATLGGFDPAMSLAGEDLDLCWGAQVAGARVVVAPAAVVRHLEATDRGLRGLDGNVTAASEPPPTAERGLLGEQRDVARLRAVLKNYSRLSLLRVLPQLAGVSILEVTVALAAGQRRRAGAVVRTWRANLRSWRDIRRARRRLRPVRAVPDRELRQLQSRGNVQLRAALRAAAGTGAELHLPGGAEVAAAWREGLRAALVVWALVWAVALFGSRHLLGGHVPTFGELAPLPSPGTLWQHAVSGWRTTGMGAPTPAPTAFALLSFAGGVFLGHMGLLQRVLVLATVPIGAWGVVRLAHPFGSRRAKLVAGVLYVANPLVYDALAAGHWSGMVAYAAFPWAFVLLAGATRLAPYDNVVSLRRRAVSLALVLALSGAFVPALAPLTVAAAVVVALGSLVAGSAGAAWRAVWLSLAGAALAAVLLFPWVLGFLPPGGEWASIVRPPAAAGHAVSLAQLLRFQTGPNGASPLGWALLVTAALPLIVGQDWRFAWAARLWTLAAGSWALAWVAGRSWVPFALPPAEVLLVPGAVALAVCAGLGMAAFEIDLRGYHFGWRQGVSVVAAAGAALAALPALGSAFDGRWHSPSQGFDQVLSWMPDKRAEGDFRVLWVGDPAVLPIAGWRLAPGLAYATSRDGPPDITTSWPGSSRGATRLLGQGIDLASSARTTQLGHLLAPLAVRYIVVVSRAAPVHEPALVSRAPPTVLNGLAAQVDLRRVDSDPSIAVYENAAWAPARALLSTDAATASQSDDPAAVRNVELAGSPAVLPEELGPASYRGAVSGPATVLLSEATSSRWHLTVGGAGAPREAAFGSVNTFNVAGSGQATVSYRTPAVRWLAVILQFALWVIALGWLWRGRRSRRAVSP